MRAILLLLVVVFVTFAYAATKTCQPTSGVANSLCGNETHNAYVIPAKVCAYGPVDVSATSCVAQVFNTWQLVCPKRNKDLTSFCQGWGGFENIDYSSPCWVLQECTSDADCAAVDPPFGPSQTKKCYECCELCYDDCASRVGDWYAAQGDTDCTPCPYTATPHTLPPISPIAPTSPVSDNSPSSTNTPSKSSSPSGSSNISSGWTVQPFVFAALVLPMIAAF